MSEKPLPVVYILQDAYQKMIAIAKAAEPNEVLALLTGRENNDGLVITDLFIPTQEVTRGHCAMITDKILTDFLAEHTAEVIGWWHSHVNMGTFYSGEDDGTLENFGADGVRYSVGIVFALPCKTRAWLKIRKPIELEKFEVSVKIYWQPKTEITEQCNTLVKERVTEKKYMAPIYYQQDQWWKKPGVNQSPNSPPQTSTTTGIVENSTDKAVIPLSCAMIGEGRNGKFCKKHGTFKCGTKHCPAPVLNAINDDSSKKEEKPTEQRVFLGCQWADKPTVKEGEEGCEGIYNSFLPCQSCGLDKILRGVM